MRPACGFEILKDGLRRWRRHTSGVAAVEFGLLAAPFFAMVLFGIQLAVVFFSDQALQTFNDTISRTILTGSVQQQGLTQAQFTTKVCAQLPSLFSCSNLSIDVESYSAFSDADTSTPAFSYDGSCHVTNTFGYNTGTPGSIVVVRMMYPWPVVGTIIGSLVNSGCNNFLLMSVSVFKTEPYAS